MRVCAACTRRLEARALPPIVVLEYNVYGARGVDLCNTTTAHNRHPFFARLVSITVGLKCNV